MTGLPQTKADRLAEQAGFPEHSHGIDLHFLRNGKKFNDIKPAFATFIFRYI